MLCPSQHQPASDNFPEEDFVNSPLVILDSFIGFLSIIVPAISGLIFRVDRVAPAVASTVVLRNFLLSAMVHSP
jgi:hypothetical protein